jgi:hypothetical protein
MCIISLYVWVGVDVHFHYLMLMLWLHVSLRVWDVFFLFFYFLPMACDGICKFLLAQGCKGGCVLKFLMFLSAFLPHVESVLSVWMAVWDCSIGVMSASILCGDVYSAVVCWRGIELCVLVFWIAILYGIKYSVSEIKQYFVHLFILLQRAINM